MKRPATARTVRGLADWIGVDVAQGIKNDPARMMERVDCVEDGCWIWPGYVRKDGYGAISVHGKERVAHRVAYEQFVGPIPDGRVIDHVCHERRCVRPDHLRVVTVQENLQNYTPGSRSSNTGFRGVYLNPNGLYQGRVGHNRVVHYAGWFKRLDEAVEATVRLRNTLHTHNDADRA